MPALKNAKWERFAWAYVNETNEKGAPAARLAGYVGKRADQAAYDLLSKPEIQGRIKELRAERWQGLHMSRDEVLARMAQAARFDPRKLYDENGRVKPVTEWDDDTAAAISGIEVIEMGAADSGLPVVTKKVKATDKAKALDMIGKVLGVYAEDNRQQGEAGARLLDMLTQAREKSGGVGGLIRR